MMTERVITVEYLESSMSKELLCKFPDNSAFDFDYSQSGIWSPLLPRGGGGGATSKGRNLISDSSFMDELRRKLLLQQQEEDGFEKKPSISISQHEKFNKFTTKFKKKMEFKTKKKRKSLDISTEKPLIKASTTPEKGWAKVLLRAASKQFKKQKTSSSLQKIKLPHFNLINFTSTL